MMGAVGLERNTIVDNVKMGMKQRAKKGEHNGKLPLVIATSPFEQRKTLLHLFIKRITMNTSKKIETIELSFDENVDSYFSAPVAVAAGDSFQRKQERKWEKIEIAI